MYEVFKIKSLKPIPNFFLNLFDFENPQNFQKNPKT